MNSKKRIAVLISGSGSNLQSLIDLLKDSDLPGEIALVLSNKAGVYGLERAEKVGIATKVLSHRDYPDRASYDAALQSALEEAEIDIVCLAGFMRIFTEEFVAKWHGRMLNIHPSILPLFTGLQTHQRALDAGCQIGGCTVHFVTGELDGGPIIIQATVPILPNDDADSLAKRVLVQEHKLYPQALTWLLQERLTIEGNRVVLDGIAAPDASLIWPQDT